MLHEEEGENHIPPNPITFGSWPPPGHEKSNRPWGFMTKVSRGQGGRPVEWPPRSESQENLDQVSSKPPVRITPLQSAKAASSSNDQVPPPVPPRPANYPQANMEQTHMQQQQQQQMVTQQQQQRQQQQVSSSMQMKTVKQVHEYQTYEQQFSGGGSIQYQLPPQQQQQSVQYQTSQQSVSSAGQPLPQGNVAHNVPIQMSQQPGPKHGVPTPFANMTSMAQPSQQPPPSQYPGQNVAFQGQFPPNQNVGAPAHPQHFTPPSNQQPQPQQQFVNQNVNPLHHQQQHQQQAFMNASPAPPPTYNAAQNNPVPASQRVEPIYASGTTQDNPDGYTTAYSTITGEWPPKEEDGAPNLTTTYPSNFKLKDHPSFQSGPGKVVTSQPAFKITQPIRKSGDDKWPPKGSAEPTQDEVREFIRPKKNSRNYEEFFAQNALPHNYAGYRPPPGTQHRGLEDEEDEAGLSNM